MASTGSEVQALLDSQFEAMRMKDIDQLMSLYSANIVYFDLVPPLQYVGSATLRQRFLEWFDGWRLNDMEIRDSSICGRRRDRRRTYAPSNGTLKNGHEVGYWVHASDCYRRSNDGWFITPNMSRCPLI